MQIYFIDMNLILSKHITKICTAIDEIRTLFLVNEFNKKSTERNYNFWNKVLRNVYIHLLKALG